MLLVSGCDSNRSRQPGSLASRTSAPAKLTAVTAPWPVGRP